MVGRDEVRQRVHEVLVGAADGQAIVVHGPAGIGKSRVVEDALDRLDAPVWKVRAGPSLRTTPLGAFALAAPDAVIGASDRRGLVQSLADAIALRPPTAIWIDDAHHLDAESATVVLHLVRQATVPVAITLRDGDELVGQIGYFHTAPYAVQLGYALGRRYWGRGLAGEALQLVVDHLRSDPALYRAAASVHPDNARSMRVLERAGFTLEARQARAQLFPNLAPEPQDALLYGMALR